MCESPVKVEQPLERRELCRTWQAAELPKMRDLVTALLTNAKREALCALQVLRRGEA